MGVTPSPQEHEDRLTVQSRETFDNWKLVLVLDSPDGQFHASAQLGGRDEDTWRLHVEPPTPHHHPLSHATANVVGLGIYLRAEEVEPMLIGLAEAYARRLRKRDVHR